MARTKAAKRKKGGHTSSNMLRAIQLNREGMSLRKAAAECNVSYPTLFRYVKKNKDVSDESLIHKVLTPRYDINKTFSDDQEEALKQYIKDCALKFYGLTSKDVRRVAYQMAKVNNIKHPDTWDKEQLAGKEWLRSFKSRHPDISMKKPEACSLARATAFNKETVKTFYKNLKCVMERHPSFGNGCRLYNLDETATTTVQKPQKVLAPKGKHNISKVTSGERGTLVTTCAIVCASGQALPPVLVFPRKKFKDFMIQGAPPGSLGLAAPTGWMNADLFVEVMKHFIKQTSASPENPALLIMDNHESHLSIEALELAKRSGVTILTLHPHTTAKMQPLDVGLNGPFKVYYNSAVDSWMMRNPGKPMTIYNVAECVGQAYAKSMTPINIASAFKKCGIFPYDDNIFTEIDFMPSYVTDRDQPGPSSSVEEPEEPQFRDATTSPDSDVTRVDSPSIFEVNKSLKVNADGSAQDNETARETLDLKKPLKAPYEPDYDSLNRMTATASPIKMILSNKSPMPGCSSNKPMTLPSGKKSASELNTETTPPPVKQNFVCSKAGKQFKTPEDFMPALKAGPRTGKRKPRKLGRSMVATDTPEKEQIFEDRKKSKQRKSAAKAIKRPVLCDKKGGKKLKKAKIQSESETSTEEDEEDPVCLSETDLSGLDDEEELDEDELPVITENFKKLERKVNEGDFVLVLLNSKKFEVYYVGKIIEVISSTKYCVSFLRLKIKDMMKFAMPLEPDLSEIDKKQIKMILPAPKINGSKIRNSTMVFPVRVSPKIILR